MYSVNYVFKIANFLNILSFIKLKTSIKIMLAITNVIISNALILLTSMPKYAKVIAKTTLPIDGTRSL